MSAEQKSERSGPQIEFEWDRGGEWAEMATQNLLLADRSEEMVTALCKSLVRPHLEYCTQVWSIFDKRYKVVRRSSAEGHVGTW